MLRVPRARGQDPLLQPDVREAMGLPLLVQALARLWASIHTRTPLPSRRSPGRDQGSRGKLLTYFYTLLILLLRRYVTVYWL